MSKGCGQWAGRSWES